MPRDYVLLESSELAYGRPAYVGIVYYPLAREDVVKTAKRLAVLEKYMTELLTELKQVAARSRLALGNAIVLQNDHTPDTYRYRFVLIFQGEASASMDALYSRAIAGVRVRLNGKLTARNGTDSWYWPAEIRINPILREMQAARKDVGLDDG